MAQPDNLRVVILGGGMAGLAAAWELSHPDRRDRVESVTVYQRGWRLGGKGASSRGVNGRIEEHGLHVLLGYYHETFRMLEDVYEQLDRVASDPHCPIATWDDAVRPSGTVGLADQSDDGWAPWVTEFSTTPLRPGAPGRSSEPLDLVNTTVRSLRLLIDFLRSQGRPPGTVTMSASPHPPVSWAEDPGALLQAAGLTALAASLEVLHQLEQVTDALTARMRVTGALHDALRALRNGLEARVAADPVARRVWGLVDLVFTNVRGIAVDRLLTRPEGTRAIDHLDYREWLRGHGASRAATDNAIVRGMYDLALAYEAGDPDRPQFGAGLGLELATRMLLDHDGGIFWRMEAGMGEIIFAPLYQALRRRGVEFRFFHRVDNLRLDAAQRAIETVELGVQATVSGGPGAYDPLINVGGLPCWPDGPLIDQLKGGARLAGEPLESMWCEAPDVGAVELHAGVDFDIAVFAISLGMVPHICPELVKASPRWSDMVANVATVPTQAFQMWLREGEAALGWPGPPGVTLSGFAEPFDTWASMSHLLIREQWPETDSPRSLAYFCGALNERDGTDNDAVRQAAVEFLDTKIAGLWPAAVDANGFRWDLLVGDEGVGPARFDTQYWRANVDPSDRYVQSLPGTDSYRLAPGDAGFANLVIAGDWTDSGLNAGCIEAATRSGRLAAEAVIDSVTKGTQDD